MLVFVEDSKKSIVVAAWLDVHLPRGKGGNKRGNLVTFKEELVWKGGIFEL